MNGCGRGIPTYQKNDTLLVKMTCEGEVAALHINLEKYASSHHCSKKVKTQMFQLRSFGFLLYCADFLIDPFIASDACAVGMNGSCANDKNKCPKLYSGLNA